MEKIERYKDTLFNLRWYIENCLRVVNKEGEIVPLRLNRVQEKVVKYVQANYGVRPIRLIILKARQMGITTIVSAIGYWVASMHSNMRYGIVAHNSKSAESIYQKARLYYNLIEKELRPATTRLSGEGIRFQRENGRGLNSEIMFATVSESVFRGETMQMLHESERAYYEGDIRAIDASISPCVPRNKISIHIKESTANGDNYYKDEYDRAVKGESEWVGMFFGWNEMAEYRSEVPKGFKANEYEIKLMMKHKLDLEQIVWRRRMIEDTFGGEEMMFRREYPLTASEAFTTSGSGVFDAERINKLRVNERIGERVRLTEYIGEWIRYKDVESIKREVARKEKRWDVLRGEYRDYEIDETDIIEYQRPYVMGVDTSGLGKDKNVVYVLDGISGEVVGKYSEKVISEHNLAKVIKEIGRYYNNALVVCETNYSHSVYDVLEELGYKALYYSERVDKVNNAVINEYGFRTTQRSKPLIINNLIKCLDEGLVVPDREFYDETNYFRILNDNGKMGAPNGKHDDHIMALAIGLWVVVNSGQVRKSVNELERLETRPRIIKEIRRPRGRMVRRGMYTNDA